MTLRTLLAVHLVRQIHRSFLFSSSASRSRASDNLFAHGELPYNVDDRPIHADGLLAARCPRSRLAASIRSTSAANCAFVLSAISTSNLQLPLGQRRQSPLSRFASSTAACPVRPRPYRQRAAHRPDANPPVPAASRPQRPAIPAPTRIALQIQSARSAAATDPHSRPPPVAVSARALSSDDLLLVPLHLLCPRIVRVPLDELVDFVGNTCQRIWILDMRPRFNRLRTDRRPSAAATCTTPATHAPPSTAPIAASCAANNSHDRCCCSALPRLFLFHSSKPSRPLGSFRFSRHDRRLRFSVSQVVRPRRRILAANVAASSCDGEVGDRCSHALAGRTNIGWRHGRRPAVAASHPTQPASPRSKSNGPNRRSYDRPPGRLPPAQSRPPSAATAP